MAMFKAFVPNVEVNGETVLSVVDGMGAFQTQALQILAECGIKDPVAGTWYAQQAWLDAFRRISDSVGPKTLFSIGLKIPEHAKFPPEIQDAHAALAAIDVAYHMNHRHGEIGHYHYQKTGETSAVITGANPYPCDFDRGIVEAMVRKFAPQSRVSAVRHDDKAPCRKKGGESCRYDVSW